MSEEKGDDASETAVNITKSPGAPKARVQPCEPAAVADSPSPASQAPLSLGSICSEEQQQRAWKGTDRNSEGMEAVSVWCPESEPGQRCPRRLCPVKTSARNCEIGRDPHANSHTALGPAS